MADKTAFQHLLTIARLSKPSAADEPLPEFHVPTPTEEAVYMDSWQTDLESTQIALNLWLLYTSQRRRLGEDDISDLARAIQRYGDGRAESAIERYQEQGE